MLISLVLVHSEMTFIEILNMFTAPLEAGWPHQTALLLIVSLTGLEVFPAGIFIMKEN